MPTTPPPRPTPPPARGRRNGCLRALALTAGGLVGLALLIGVAIPAGHRALLTRQLRRAADDARPDALARLDAEARALRESAAAAYGVTATPAYAATFDLCYTDHHDQGWMAVGYEHHCQLTRVELLEVAPDSVLGPALQRTVAGPYRWTYGLDLAKDTGRRWDPPHGTELGITAPGLTDARAVLDDRMVPTTRVVAYAARDAYDARRLLAESGDPRLAPDRRHLVLAHPVEYVGRDIGCRIPQVLFCTSPLE